MSLVEVIVAMTILTGVLLVLGGFSVKFSQAASQARLVVGANEIAASRIDEMRTQGTYGAIDLLASPAAGDPIKTDFTTFTRVTTVSRVGGSTAKDSTDYKVLTVVVTHPSMKKAVMKTAALAAF